MKMARFWNALAVILLAASPCVQSNMTMSSESLAASVAMRMLRAQRELQFDDMEIELDLDNGVIYLPNITSANEGLEVNLYNLYCRDIGLEGMTVDHLQQPTQLITTLRVYGIAMYCSGLYSYSTMRQGGDEGTVEMWVSDSGIEAEITLISDDLEQFPPHALQMTGCDATIQVSSILLDGDEQSILNAILSRVATRLASIFAQDMEVMICDAVSSTEDPLNEAVATIYDQIQANSDQAVERVDPLLAEEDLQASLPADIALVDFTNTNSSNVAEAVGMIITAVGDLLSGSIEEGNGEIALNRLMANFLDDDGGYSIDLASIEQLEQIDEMVLNATSNFGLADFRLDNVTIYGLNNFTYLQLGEILGPHTLLTSLTIEQVTVKVGGTMEVVRSDGVNTDIQHFIVNLAVDRAEASLALLLAIDESKLSTLQVGTLLNTDDFECLKGILYSVQVASLYLEELVLGKLSVSGFDNHVLPDLVEFMDVLYSAYRPFIAPIVESNIVNATNNIVGTELLDGSQVEACPGPPEPSGPDGYMDFRDLLLSPAEATRYGASGTEPYGAGFWSLMEKLDAMTTEIDPETGEPMINSHIGNWTESQSGIRGTLVKEEVIDTALNMSDQGTFAVAIRNLNLINLDTFAGNPMELMAAVMNEPFLIHSDFAMGTPSRPMTLAMDLLIDAQSESFTAQGLMRVNMQFDIVKLVSTFHALVSEEHLFAIPFEDMANLYCWLAVLPPPVLDENGRRVEGSVVPYDFTEFIADTEGFQGSIECVQCDELTTDVVQIVNDFMNGETAVDIDLSSILGMRNMTGGAESVSEMIMMGLDKIVVDAATYCPHRDEYDETAIPPGMPRPGRPDRGDLDNPVAVNNEEAVTIERIVVYAFMGLLLSAFLIYMLLRCLVNRRHRKWLATLSRNQLVAVYAGQEREDAKNTRLNKMSTSLMSSPHTTTVSKIMVPVLIFVSTILYVAGCTMDSLSLYVSAEIVGDEVLSMVDNQSFLDQVKFQWNDAASGKTTAIAMVLLSGVWPVLKQVLTLGLWMAPPNVVLVQKRGVALRVVDVLGKWCLFVIFLMLIVIVSVRSTLVSEIPISGGIALSVDLYLKPSTGMYLFCFAQILGQLASQTALHYHRLSLRAVALEEAKTNGPSCSVADVSGEGIVTCVTDESPKPLCRQSFRRYHKGESKLEVRRGANVVVIIWALLVFALIILGNYLTLAKATMGGFIAAFSNEGAPATDYTSFGIIKLLFELAADEGASEDYIGFVALALLMAVTVVAVPLILTVSLLIKWLFPLVRPLRRYVTVEILASVNYLDVFFLAVFLGTLQTEAAVEKQVEYACAGIDQMLRVLVEVGTLPESAGTCLTVESTMQVGSLVLLASLACLTMFRAFVVQAFIQRIKFTDPTLFSPDATAAAERISSEDTEDIAKKIRPVPLLFTDRFRWFLTTPEGGGGSQRTL